MKKRILLIDDEMILHELLEFAIGKFFIIDKALNIKDGLIAVKGYNYPVIITELSFGLENTAGLRILEKIKDIAPFTNVIVLSNNFLKDDSDQALENGAVEFVAKGNFSGVEMRKKIMNWIENYYEKIEQNHYNLTTQLELTKLQINSLVKDNKYLKSIIEDDVLVSPDKWQILKNHIGDNNTDYVIEILLKDKESEFSDEIILIKAQYRSVKSQYRKGIVDDNFHRIEINKINHGLIEIINELKRKRKANNT